MSSQFNLHQLPQISLSKMYESCGSSRNITKKCDDLGKAHTKQIMVQSPFYEKHEDHKGPCTCAYHRMKRYKEVATIFKGSTNLKVKQQIQQYKTRIAAAIRSTADVKKTQNKIVFKIRAKGLFRTADQSRQQESSGTGRQKVKPSLDNYNSLFEQILRKRMSPIPDKQKAANLIKFIKVTSTINPNYLKKIRQVIYNHLVKVVGKVSYDKLINANEEDKDLQKKISNIINAKSELTNQFIRGIQKSVRDMQGFIIERAQKKFNEQQEKEQVSKQITLNRSESLKKLESVHSKNNSRKGSSNQIVRQDKQNVHHQDKKKQEKLQQKKCPSLCYLKTPNNDTNYSDKKNSNNLIQSQCSSRQKHALINSKRSNVSFNQDVKNFFVKNKIVEQRVLEDIARNIVLQSKNTSFQEPKKQKQNDIKEAEKYEIPKTKVWRHQSQLNQPQAAINQIGQIKSQESVKSQAEDGTGQGKNQIKSKTRKQKKKKTKLSQKKDQFAQMDYQKLLTKQQFESIKNLLRQSCFLPDSEKMKRVFNIVEKRMSEGTTHFDQFIAAFEKVLTPEQIRILKQKYEKSQYARMINKLTKQVDFCLMEIKHAQDLIWRQNQEQERGGNRKSSPQNKKTICLQVTNADESLMHQFNKFTIIEDQLPPTPPVQEPRISQKQLGEMRIEQIGIFSSQSSHSHISILKQKKQVKQDETEFEQGKLNEQKHRQILRYMMKNHAKKFNKVRHSIKDTLENSLRDN